MCQERKLAGLLLHKSYKIRAVASQDRDSHLKVGNKWIASKFRRKDLQMLVFWGRANDPFFGIPSLIMFDSQVPISDLATWLSQAFSVCLCKDLKWSHGLMAKLAKSYRHLPCLLPWFGLMTFYTWLDTACTSQLSTIQQQLRPSLTLTGSHSPRAVALDFVHS